MDTDIEIVTLGVADVDRVADLWRSMVEHHREVSGEQWPVKSGDDAWRIRRAQYVDWLTEGVGWLLVAVPASDTSDALGYATVRVEVPGATWELGREMGELESLVVAPAARGAGVGSALIARARKLLRDRGVEFWTVAVVEANTGAVRLYEREGFSSYYQSLLGRVDGGDPPDGPVSAP